MFDLTLDGQLTRLDHKGPPQLSLNHLDMMGMYSIEFHG